MISFLADGFVVQRAKILEDNSRVAPILSVKC